MAGGHRHAIDHAHLHVPGTSRLHEMSAEAKLVGLVAFVVAVALTPRHAVGAFAFDAALLAVVAMRARLPVTLVVSRLVVIVPFLVFAALVPFVAGGEQVEIVGIGVSREGMWAAFGIAAKAILGATASIVFASTTPIPEVLRGLARLRVPPVIVGIIAFMFRYLDLLVDQLRRMRHAMTARCHDPRWLWQVGPIASSAGTLFVRSYERGERVHQAMLARGFTGTMPALDEERMSGADWPLALAPGAAAIGALIVAVVT